jgi:glycosyltransferase involved in cell wall biosynthesis
LQALITERGTGRWMDVGSTIEGNEKTMFLLAADGYLHPSRWESYGLALVESLALGVPSLVSGTCHIAESLAVSGGALVVAPEPDALADGLSRLVRGEAAVGARGRAYVETELSWDRIVPAYLSDLARLTGTG